jgi:hypothetical protein
MLCLVASLASPAWAHDIYTNVHGRDGRLCCGGNDCAATTYSEDGSHYSFLTREGRWVAIPPERITFLPVPGDPPSGDSHRAHLCYRQATDDDRAGPYSENVFDNIYLYCAFIPPGGV